MLICDRSFRISRGLTQHLESYRSKDTTSTEIVAARDKTTLIDDKFLRTGEAQKVRYNWGKHDSYHCEQSYFSLVLENFAYWKTFIPATF